MECRERQAIRNAYRVIERLEPGETISREDLIEALREPLPPPGIVEYDAAIFEGYRYFVERAAVNDAPVILTYREAARASGKSEAAIKQAVYRGTLRATTLRKNGNPVRSGVYFHAFANWCKWSTEQRQIAADEVNALRSSTGETRW